jgi:SAM-dependent methyltransferase
MAEFSPTSVDSAALFQHWPQCPVCDSQTCSEFVTFNQLEFVRCAGCDTVYKSREVVGLSDPSLYEAEYHTGKRSRRWLHRIRKAQRQIRHALRFGQASTLLDIGCSVGYIVAAGNQLGMRASGVDVSAFAVKTAAERGLDVRVGTLEHIPYPDAQFGLVVMRHVLEHTATPKQALEEVRRVLSPSGLILVMVPDVNYWKGRWLKKSYRFFRPDDLGRQHAVYYSTSTLRRLLNTCGFRVLAESKARWAPHRSAIGNHFSLIGAAEWLWYWLGHKLSLRRELCFVAMLKPGANTGTIGRQTP